MSEKKTESPVFEYTGGPASESEKEVMHSTYGVLPNPQITSEGKYCCPQCGKTFNNLNSYDAHRHKNEVKNAVSKVDEPVM